MTLQYLFFDTYVGDFLQVVPVALLAGGLCLLVRVRLARRQGLLVRWPREIVMALFVCYLAGLWALVLTPNNLWTKVWYFLFYHQDSGNTITWLVLDPAQWSFDLSLSLFRRFTRENAGNMLLFLPMGVFLPLLWPRLGLGRTVGLSALISVAVELGQLLIGRAFDASDLILNTVGALLGALVLLALRRLLPGGLRQCAPAEGAWRNGKERPR